jgi:hypothetical protein
MTRNIPGQARQVKFASGVNGFAVATGLGVFPPAPPPPPPTASPDYQYIHDHYRFPGWE